MKKLIYGFGINDADYAVSCRIDGKKKMCKFYTSWVGMLKRCYSPASLKLRPTYKGCSVCIEWRSFKKFKNWMELQDWEGNHLDKDILIQGNKIYSPETCVYIDSGTNGLFSDSQSRRGMYCKGVHWSATNKAFHSQCCDGLGGRISLGFFNNEDDAEKAYKDKKSQVIRQVALRQSDSRVVTALLNRAIDLEN